MLILKSYEKFIEEIKARVEASLGEGVKVTLTQVSKNNGRMLDALVISKEGGSISPTIYMEAFWKMYKEGKGCVTITDEIVDLYGKCTIKDSVNMEKFLDFASIKDNIVFKIINRQKNRELLTDVPHIDYLDLAIVFCYIFRSGELNNATILIHNSHMENWKVSANDLMKCARENTPKLMGYRFKSILDYLRSLYNMEGLEMADGESEENVPMYILSNNEGLFGAGCILYAGLLKQLSDRLHSSFYVFPSSIHEVILLADENLDEAIRYRELVEEINRNEVAAEEVLSDSVYFYSREDDCLRLLA